MFPHPSLNVHDERAPYWLAFNLTESTIAAERHFVYVFRSLWRRVAACASVIGNENGTSAQPAFWHRWPYPTVGLPVGSGEGLATKPSKLLIRLTVAALTAGGAQAAPGRQHLKSAGPGQRPGASGSGQSLSLHESMAEENIPEAVLPEAQALVKRQLPPLPQEVLVQHRTLSGSLGQNPEWVVPPPLVQSVLTRQTPGVPPALQAPLTAARAKPAKMTRRGTESIVCGASFWLTGRLDIDYSAKHEALYRIFSLFFPCGLEWSN